MHDLRQARHDEALLAQTGALCKARGAHTAQQAQGATWALTSRPVRHMRMIEQEPLEFGCLPPTVHQNTHTLTRIGVIGPLLDLEDAGVQR